MTTFNDLTDRYDLQLQAKIKKLAFRKDLCESVSASPGLNSVGLQGTCVSTMDLAANAAFKFSKGIVPRGKVYRQIWITEWRSRFGHQL